MAFVDFSAKNKIALIKLNRTERLNAMGEELIAQLKDALQKFENDAGLRVAIITGTGRAFSVGMDVKEEAQRTVPAKNPATILDTMSRVTKPIIAAVNGLALGAGLWQLVMYCDLRIAAKSATFGMPEINLAIPAIPQHFLMEGISLCAATELVLIGEPITAKRAYEICLVNKVVPDDKLITTAMKIARRIAEHSPWAVRMIRQAYIEAIKESEERWHLRRKMHVHPELVNSLDYQEAIRAFTSKRKPVFRDK